MAPPPQPSPDPSPPRPAPRGRLGLLLAGGVVALGAGLGVAWLLVSGDHASTPPPAATGGLIIDTADAQPGKIDTGRPLRCFVQGQFVGELSLVDCAKRNGVATDALDVGLDANGALAAADQAVALAPQSREAHTARASLLTALGRTEEAEAARAQAATLGQP